MGRSLLAFAAFAAVLTVTPGLDTVLVLRLTATRGRLAGFVGAVGIALGCLCWALAGALGITALLNTSRVGYEVVRWAGAAYLCWLGVRALWTTRRRLPAPEPEPPASERDEPAQLRRPLAALRTGLATNLLNPKVGAFYLSVFPQFLPHGVPPLLGSVALAAVHIAEGLVWLGLVVLAVGRAGRWLTRPAVKRRLEQVTGAVLVAFGLRLVVEGH
jgi:threonine/homoserine/homoserine lactone efflux protein